MIFNFDLGKCIFGYVYLSLFLFQYFFIKVELFINLLYYKLAFFMKTYFLLFHILVLSWIYFKKSQKWLVKFKKNTDLLDFCIICITRRIKGKEFKIFKGYRNNKICLPLSCWADGCPAVVSSQSPERQREGADLSSSTADYDHGPPDTHRLLQPRRTLRQYVPSKHLYTHKYSWVATFMD